MSYKKRDTIRAKTLLCGLVLPALLATTCTATSAVNQAVATIETANSVSSKIADVSIIECKN